MENVSKMEMAPALFQKNYIKTEKVFFGFKTKVTYTPTNSAVVGDSLQYDIPTGEKVKEVLSSALMDLDTHYSSMGFLKPVDNGGYCLNLCYSVNHRFAALQLMQYRDFGYKPLDQIRFAQGDEAEKLLKFFVK